MLLLRSYREEVLRNNRSELHDYVHADGNEDYDTHEYTVVYDNNMAVNFSVDLWTRFASLLSYIYRTVVSAIKQDGKNV